VKRELGKRKRGRGGRHCLFGLWIAGPEYGYFPVFALEVLYHKAGVRKVVLHSLVVSQDHIAVPDDFCPLWIPEMPARHSLHSFRVSPRLLATYINTHLASVGFCVPSLRVGEIEKEGRALNQMMMLAMRRIHSSMVLFQS